jgi:hypothetical protein
MPWKKPDIGSRKMSDMLTKIREHAATQAAASNWDAVAEILNRRDQVMRLRDKASGKVSFEALLAARLDPNSIIAKLRAVPIGSELMDTLTSHGVDWTDTLTIGVLQQCGVAATAIAALRGTIEAACSLAESIGLEPVTAQQCQQAIAAPALHSRVVNAAALATERINTDMTAEQSAVCWATCWQDTV